jgi:hypothetical protein
MEAAMTEPDQKLIALANLITELEPRESAAVSAAIETGGAGLAQARIDAITEAMDNLLEEILQLPPPKTMEGLRAMAYAIVQRCECEPVFDEPRTLFERSVVALLLGLAGDTRMPLKS